MILIFHILGFELLYLLAMKILITGGTGLLAGRIAKYLNSIGKYEIILGSRNGSDDFMRSSEFKIVKTIWESEIELQLICKGVDTIIHLAGMNATDSFADPLGALEFNGLKTGRLLSAAISSGVKKFIYFSTAHVYKTHLTGIVTEETLPSSFHPYATSHKAGEDMVMGAHLRNEIEGIVIRLSNSFGAPVNKEANCWMLLVNDLCKQAITSGKMRINTSGLQRRDFISITDVCRVVEHFLAFSFKNESNNLFNVGGGWSPTVWELGVFIRQICKNVLFYEPDLSRIEPLPNEFSREFEYKTNKLQKTGFVMSNSREEEISNLLLYCRSNFPFFKQ